MGAVNATASASAQGRGGGSPASVHARVDSTDHAGRGAGRANDALSIGCTRSGSAPGQPESLAGQVEPRRLPGVRVVQDARRHGRPAQLDQRRGEVADPGRAADLIVDHGRGSPARSAAAAWCRRSSVRARRTPTRCARRARGRAARPARPPRRPACVRPYAVRGPTGSSISYGLVRVAGEDVVGRHVHQPTAVARPAPRPARRAPTWLTRSARVLVGLGGVDRGVRGGVHHDVGTVPGQDGVDHVGIGDVELRARVERDDVGAGRAAPRTRCVPSWPPAPVTSQLVTGRPRRTRFGAPPCRPTTSRGCRRTTRSSAPGRLRRSE